jgi:hypothetical protein
MKQNLNSKTKIAYENSQSHIKYETMTKKSIWYILILIFILNNEIKAQIFQPNENNHHIVGLNFGFDNSLVGLTLGYAYYMPKYKTSAFINFSQGSALLGTGDYKMQIGLQSWQGSFDKFTLKSSVGITYVRSVNVAGNYSGLGTTITINPGFKFSRFGVGLDFEYNPFFATYITHSAYYRQYGYTDVKDGWYGSTSQNLRIGTYVLEQIGPKKTSELNLKVGYQNNGIYDKLIPNLYAIIGLNKSF